MLPTDEIDKIKAEILQIRDPVTRRTIFNVLEAYRLAVVAYIYQHPDFNDEILC